jgi:hypothetical protein
MLCRTLVVRKRDNKLVLKLAFHPLEAQVEEPLHRSSRHDAPGDADPVF